MDNKLFSRLMIFSYVFLAVIVGNCYATQGTDTGTTSPPAASPPTSSSSVVITPSNQDVELANKLFNDAGYQYFQINKDIDSDKKHPELFTVPDGTDDDVDVNN